MVSFKKRSKGCDGDSVRLQWVCAQIKAGGEEKIPSAKSEQARFELVHLC